MEYKIVINILIIDDSNYYLMKYFLFEKYKIN